MQDAGGQVFGGSFALRQGSATIERVTRRRTTGSGGAWTPPPVRDHTERLATNTQLALLPSRRIRTTTLVGFIL